MPFFSKMSELASQVFFSFSAALSVSDELAATSPADTVAELAATVL